MLEENWSCSFYINGHEDGVDKGDSINNRIHKATKNDKLETALYYKSDIKEWKTGEIASNI